MSNISKRLPDDYAALLAEVKERVRSAQYAALKAATCKESLQVRQGGGE